MKKKKWELDRRTFLMGTGGAALALPFLEVMMPSLARAQAAGLVKPVFGAVFFGNGCNDMRWLPKATGTITQANCTGTTMEEFASRGLLGHFSTMTGTYIYQDGINGQHPQDSARFLTGWYPPVVSRIVDRGGMGEMVNRESLDQWIARMNGGKSWTTGIRNFAYSDGWTTGFNKHISWKKDPNEASYNFQSVEDYDRVTRKVSHPTKIYADKYTQPIDLFNQLFPGGQVPQGGGGTPAPEDPRKTLRKTIVDLTYANRSKLYSLLGTEDKQKMESWFNEVHEHQQSLQASAATVGSSCPASVSGDTPDSNYRETDGNRYDLDNFEVHLDAMFKTIKLGIQCGLVDNFTVMLTEAVNYNRHRKYFQDEYASLNIPSLQHHTFGHDFFTKAQFAQSDLVIHLADRLQARPVAKFLQDLNTTQMGANTALHDSLIMYGGALGNPSYHNANSFPTLIAGNARGQINMNGGRHIDLTEEAGVGAKYRVYNANGTPRYRPVAQENAIHPTQGWVKHGNILRAVGELCTGKSAAGQFNDNAQIDLKNLLK